MDIKDTNDTKAVVNPSVNPSVNSANVNPHFQRPSEFGLEALCEFCRCIENPNNEREHIHMCKDGGEAMRKSFTEVKE